MLNVRTLKRQIFNHVKIYDKMFPWKEYSDTNYNN